jgi:hypothetical protein
MKRLCIVGTGAAGLQLLLLLTQKGVHPERITLLDPFHDGGDLKRKWSSVRSNTVWRQILEACPPRVPLPEPWKSLNPEQPCYLNQVIEYLRWLVQPVFRRCHIRTGFLDSATNLENGSWSLQLKNGQTLETDVLFLCTGSEPKTLDLPLPSIPLEVALDVSRLSQYVQPHHRLLLFGLAHSGTLIAGNTQQLQVPLTVFYNTPKPFLFARDGEYDGIKQDSAEIADKILQGDYKLLQLCTTQDIPSLIRASQEADFAIYAIGFQARKILANQEYDPHTGQLCHVQQAWGFGIAFPNVAPDGLHFDVSVPSFQAHMEKQLPNILSLVGIDE